MTVVDAPSLYPPCEAYDRQWLAVPGGHRLHIEQSGHPGGRPLLLLHGGPGSRASAMQRRFFDPARFRIIQFDQRGCGLSEPAGELRHNHSTALVADIERIRLALGIERWWVCGGSWGATLALLYAAAHRPAVDGLLLRALFLAGQGDLDWFFGGAGAVLPAQWQRFLDHVPRSRRRHLQAWLWRLFERGDEASRLRAALAWLDWERALHGGEAVSAVADPVALLQRYRIQAHYLSRRCFVGEAGVLAALARLHGLPVLLLHGRQDLVCRPQNSWRAWRTLAGSRLLWVDGAGHDPFAPAMAGAMRAAADQLAHAGSVGTLGEISAADRPARRSMC